MDKQTFGRKVKQTAKFSDKKVVILEYRENQQIDDDVEGHPEFGPLFPRLRQIAMNQPTASPRAKRSEGDQEQKPPVPPSVKHIARDQHKSILPLQLVAAASERIVKHKPIEQENYWQEQGKLEAIE